VSNPAHSRRFSGAAAVVVALASVLACARSGAQQPASLTVSPESISLEVGQSATVRVAVRDASGAAIAPAVTWSSDNPAIVRVSASGAVAATGAGVSGITARAGGLFGSVRVIVHPRDSAPALGPTTRSPHFSHISIFYTDFYSTWASPRDRAAAIAFLAPRVDGIMSGSREAWKGANPTLRHFPYALQYTVIRPIQKNAKPSLGSTYLDDMRSWYTAHRQYDFESTFLHRGGHDEAHRLPFQADTMRWLINPGDAGSRAYQADRIRRLAQDEDGVFLDEFGGPMGASRPSDEYQSFASYMTAETGMIAQAHAAIAPRILLINIAEYWRPVDSVIVAAGGGAHLERTNFPFTDRTEERWSEIDHLVSAGVYTEFVSLFSYTEWVTISRSNKTFNAGMYRSTADRGQMAQLASYYMAVPADPQRLSFDQQNYWNVRPDSVWSAAVEMDVGHPREARRVIARGRDPKGQSYRIYARALDHALVLMRPRVDWHPQTYGDDTGVVVPLPAPMRLLHRDGTLGLPVTSVTLRNVEAAILLR
jgi:hypothetical protein